jgi:NAD(P)-dependent dehydrogenase (short-subunit alcohol dehydrogenase family)
MTVQLTTIPSALITGSSRGIGRGIAIKLAECGVERIGVHYLKRKDEAEQTARMVEQYGARAVLLQADVTRAEDISRMFGEAREAIGAWAYSLPTHGLTWSISIGRRLISLQSTGVAQWIAKPPHCFCRHVRLRPPWWRKVGASWL